MSKQQLSSFLASTRSAGVMLRQAAWPSRHTVDAFAGAARDAAVQQAHDLLFKSVMKKKKKKKKEKEKKE